MITLFQVDKSGRDIFEKDYSIALIVNKKKVYGINIPQEIKDRVMHEFREGKLWLGGKSEKRNKMRLRVRFHTIIITMLMQKAIKDQGQINEINIEICNDFDGHFHEIKNMIYMHLSKLIPSLKREDIIQTKFQKPSFIDKVAKDFGEKVKNPEYIHVKINIDDLIKLLKR